MNPHSDVDQSFLDYVQKTIHSLMIDFNDFCDHIQADEAGVRYFNGFIERNRALFEKATIEALSIDIGLLLGAAIIEKYAGKWIFLEGNPQKPAISLAEGGLIAFPLEKTHAYFQDAEEKSILAYYFICDLALKRHYKQYEETDIQGIKTLITKD